MFGSAIEETLHKSYGLNIHELRELSGYQKCVCGKGKGKGIGKGKGKGKGKVKV